MRAVWTFLVIAGVVLAIVHTHHKNRRHAESTFAAQTAGHHHHVRSHRVRATTTRATALPTRGAPIVEHVVAQAIDAPGADLAAPVARGPPSG